MTHDELREVVPYTGWEPSNSSTGARGVCYNRAMRKYLAKIQVNGKRLYLGAFDTVREAAEAYLKAAGKPVEGSDYRRRYINGKHVPHHRIVWEAAHGPIPAGMFIDHIDGNKTNNDLANLRLATPAQNQWNKLVSRSNPLGAKGVYLNKKTGRYCAKIKALGKEYYLGSFSTVAQASAAYEEAALRLHGEYASPLRPAASKP